MKCSECNKKHLCKYCKVKLQRNHGVTPDHKPITELSPRPYHYTDYIADRNKEYFRVLAIETGPVLPSSTAYREHTTNLDRMLYAKYRRNILRITFKHIVKRLTTLLRGVKA